MGCSDGRSSTAVAAHASSQLYILDANRSLIFLDAELNCKPFCIPFYSYIAHHFYYSNGFPVNCRLTFCVYVVARGIKTGVESICRNLVPNASDLIYQMLNCLYLFVCIFRLCSNRRGPFKRVTLLY